MLDFLFFLLAGRCDDGVFENISKKKKQKTFFFPVVNPAALISRKASVAVASADWLLVSLQLQNLPMSSAGAGDASGDAMWPHHSPALTPQL